MTSLAYHPPSQTSILHQHIFVYVRVFAEKEELKQSEIMEKRGELLVFYARVGSVSKREKKGHKSLSDKWKREEDKNRIHL